MTEPTPEQKNQWKALFAATFPEQEDELGFSREKVINRARLESWAGQQLIYNVERHRATLGETYSRGSSMAAYIAYWPRFEFNLGTEEASPLPEIDSQKVVVDAHSFVSKQLHDYSFEFEHIGTGTHLMRETCTCTQEHVRNLKDVRDVADMIADFDPVEPYKHDLGDRVDEIRNELRAEYRDQMREKAFSEWRQYRTERRNERTRGGANHTRRTGKR